MAKRSAGILLYRRRGEGVELLLVHPGGPLWARKDAGAWSIPKGEYGDGEDPLAVALREFEEETGHRLPEGGLVALGEVRQRGGKVVSAWAVAGDVDPDTITSNTFTLEWPPRSGTRREFPEVDRAGGSTRPRPGRSSWPPRPSWSTGSWPPSARQDGCASDRGLADAGGVGGVKFMTPEPTKDLSHPAAQELLHRLTGPPCLHRSGRPSASDPDRVPLGRPEHRRLHSDERTKGARAVKRANVALTIDTEDTPATAKALVVRGVATIDIVDGVPGDYIASATKAFNADDLREFEPHVRSVYKQMARISITPNWARYYDFGAGRVPAFLTRLP